MKKNDYQQSNNPSFAFNKIKGYFQLNLKSFVDVVTFNCSIEKKANYDNKYFWIFLQMKKENNVTKSWSHFVDREK